MTTDTHTATPISDLVEEVQRPYVTVLPSGIDLTFSKEKHRAVYLQRVASYHGTSSAIYAQALAGAAFWWAS